MPEKNQTEQFAFNSYPRRIDRIIRILWICIILLVIASVWASLQGFFSYTLGILVAFIVAGFHFLLRTKVKQHGKQAWLSWLPAIIAVLTPVLFFGTKVMFAGGAASYAVRKVLTLGFGGLAPMLLLFLAIYRLNDLKDELSIDKNIENDA